MLDNLRIDIMHGDRDFSVWRKRVGQQNPHGMLGDVAFKCMLVP
jgi:hypothetical protein